MCRIAILLATYNSALYLNDLLESVVNQTIQDWQLFLVDDGSTDGTMNIVESYLDKKSNIFVVKNKHLHNGPMNNFMYLLSLVDSNYYMFCDHDDIWLPNKIEESLCRMISEEKKHPNKPIVIHSDLCVVDSSLNIISKSFFNYASISPTVLLSSINHLSHSNCVVGCTMFFNKQAKDVSYPISKYALMHDSWISLKVLAAEGVISCINKSLILYRQHANNTLGAITKYKHVSISKKIKNNWNQYLMAHDVVGIGIFKFILYRIIYLCKR